MTFLTFGGYILWSEKNILDAQVIFVSLAFFTILSECLELFTVSAREIMQVSLLVFHSRIFRVAKKLPTKLQPICTYKLFEFLDFR